MDLERPDAQSPDAPRIDTIIEDIRDFARDIDQERLEDKRAFRNILDKLPPGARHAAERTTAPELSGAEMASADLTLGDLTKAGLKIRALTPRGQIAPVTHFTSEYQKETLDKKP